MGNTSNPTDGTTTAIACRISPSSRLYGTAPRKCTCGASAAISRSQPRVVAEPGDEEVGGAVVAKGLDEDVGSLDSLEPSGEQKIRPRVRPDLVTRVRLGTREKVRDVHDRHIHFRARTRGACRA